MPYMTSQVLKVSYHEMPGCMEALKAHLGGGLLVEHDEAIHGPLTWLFYGQFIEKPNQPGVYRVVGDFGPLNDRIFKDCYDIQTVDQIWKQVKPDSKLFFVCNTASSYNQIQNTASTAKDGDDHSRLSGATE